MRNEIIKGQNAKKINSNDGIVQLLGQSEIQPKWSRDLKSAALYEILPPPLILHQFICKWCHIYNAASGPLMPVASSKSVIILPLPHDF
jgi:hypothetical protein